jgi:hypothetical protein
VQSPHIRHPPAVCHSRPSQKRTEQGGLGRIEQLERRVPATHAKPSGCGRTGGKEQDCGGQGSELCGEVHRCVRSRVRHTLLSPRHGSRTDQVRDAEVDISDLSQQSVEHSLKSSKGDMHNFSNMRLRDDTNDKSRNYQVTAKEWERVHLKPKVAMPVSRNKKRQLGDGSKEVEAAVDRARRKGLLVSRSNAQIDKKLQKGEVKRAELIAKVMEDRAPTFSASASHTSNNPSAAAAEGAGAGSEEPTAAAAAAAEVPATGTSADLTATGRGAGRGVGRGGAGSSRGGRGGRGRGAAAPARGSGRGVTATGRRIPNSARAI